jgi:2-amino-4-hydroxy-6-hydroxymethyldihydropteridine diphosphokinase
MIYLAFGSNLKSKFGCCSFVINKAYGELEKFGIRILSKSSFYKSKAYPNPKDPEFVNSVILVNSEIHVTKLLNIILKIEKKFGRVRSQKNAPRTIDIDIIDFRSKNISILNKNVNLTIPHDSLESRLFVLEPLAEISPYWKNPRTGVVIPFLIKKIKRLKDNRITKI